MSWKVRFQQSEFAADISRVANGTATPEYQDPENFYARTFVTEGMQQLLVSVAKRSSGRGGEPVIELQTNFGRVNSIWRPVSAEEGFEIVKRRLFENITDTASIDETCGAFAELYLENRSALPTVLQEGAWAEKMKRCYPIHPEIFARLYEDWSTMPKFQKTRGVLQLMAIVINRLWQRGDNDPMIMPGSLPLDDTQVVNKCTQYLPNGWGAIIDREIDGAGSSAAAVDRADPRLGGMHAAVRVARTVFLGSASGSAAQGVRGIDVKKILLGCALPGQQFSFYGDAIRKLREQQHYLFNQDENFSNPPLQRAGAFHILSNCWNKEKEDDESAPSRRTSEAWLKKFDEILKTP